MSASFPRSDHRRAAALLMITAVAGACLPIRITTFRSPALVGVYRRADGTPVVGARLTVSTTPKDLTCAHVAATAITDSAGTFHLGATRGREYLALFEGVRAYRLCVGDEGERRLVFEWNELRVPPRSDSLACGDTVSPAGLVLTECVSARGR